MRSSFVIATPADPAPFTTTRQSSFFFPVTFRALMIPARTTIAVPCWSSWKTECSEVLSDVFQFRNTVEHEMSSRLIPPKAGAMLTTDLIISSCPVIQTDRNCVDTTESLNRHVFPSITGIAASCTDVSKTKNSTSVRYNSNCIGFHSVIYMQLQDPVRSLYKVQQHPEYKRCKILLLST